MGIRHFLRAILGYPDEPYHDYIASSLSFAELDIERMKRRMKLAEEGQHRGTRNEPAAESLSLDDVEQRVITTMESEKRLTYEKLVDHLKTYGDRVASLGFHTKFTQALATADGVITDFRAKVHIGADLLFHLRCDVIRIEDDMQRFRQEHHLQRLPQYPQSRMLRWGVIITLLVLEGVLNGTFLARGHEFGLVGGITEAFGIAAMNIVSGLVVGWKVAPERSHRGPLRKLMGYFGIVLYVVWMFGFNLGVAHYRYALGGEQPEQASQLAFVSLFTHPFGIADMQSWFLFALGCLFSLVAVVDGLSMDDPYPGYGALARRQGELMEEYTAQKQDLMADLEDIKNAALDRMVVTAEGIERRQAEYRAILEARTRIKRAFSQYLNYLEQCGNDLLATYREANRRARSTPPPCHFSQRWDMARFSELEFDQEEHLGDLEAGAGIGQFFDHLEEKRQRVHKEYETAVFEYKRIDELTREGVRDGRFYSPSEEADAK